MNDLDRVLNGQCLHGQQGDCVTCSMTRYLAVSLRHVLTHMFPPTVEPEEDRHGK